jgi:sulfur-carrier protein adenylyltransferase/sulfurtransferase
VDGSDTFATRYVSNDVATALRMPNVYGSVFRYEGQASVFAPHLGGPCYRCLFPHPPAPGAVPTCAESGVLGVLPGLVGMIQAAETIKLLTGVGTTLMGRMFHVDTRSMHFRELALRRDPECLGCGPDAQPWVPAVDVPSCATRLGAADCLLDVRAAWETTLVPLEMPDLAPTLASAGVHLAIPWENLEARLGELPRSGRVVAICSIGERSAAAVAWLRANGFPLASHVAGGIRALEDQRGLM